MMGKPGLALALAACWGFCQPAFAQSTKTSARPALELDPGRASGPDPLTPPETNGQPLLAPGAAEAASEAAPTETNPIIEAVRRNVATVAEPQDPGAREDLAALKAYYALKAQPLWMADGRPSARATQAIDAIGQADQWGLTASAFALPPPLEEPATADTLAMHEIALSLAALKYARHARGGRVEPAAVSRIFDQKPPLYEPQSLLQAFANTQDIAGYLQGLHPNHEQFSRLRQALLAARAGPAHGGTNNTVRRLLVNLERWRWMPVDLGDFYVWDNVPEQMTRVIDRNKVTFLEKIVVGKPSTPTPVFTAHLQFIIFHPSWGVPPGMKVQELWPQLRNTGSGWFFSKPLASAVLAGHGLSVSRGGQPVNPDAVDWSKVDIRGFDFTQPPGPRNVLGIVKFRFPNKHDVYMHDTPERHLFGGTVRAFSHGCMRVQNPIRLAEVLIAHDKGWPASDVEGFVRRGGEISLTAPIPVHVTYFTAAVDDTGTLHTFGDLYALDQRVASALKLEPAQPAITSANAQRDGARRAPRTRARPPQSVKAPSRPAPFVFSN
jgi:murein L,D-transpeptidase YcbB/YkuD